jgi:potassium/chloride transporter 4/5/6
MKTKDYPDLKSYQKGTIDMWFIIHDGGLMLQIGYLLSLDRIWKNCKLRLFTVAHAHDNSIRIKEDLVTYLKLLRIEAEVKVIEMVIGSF